MASVCVVDVQWGRQDMHTMLHPANCHVAVDHAHHGVFDVIVFRGEKVNGPGLKQALERCHTHFGLLHVIQSRMAAMALAISVPCLLVRGHAQAHSGCRCAAGPAGHA